MNSELSLITDVLTGRALSLITDVLEGRALSLKTEMPLLQCYESDNRMTNGKVTYECRMIFPPSKLNQTPH